MNTMSLTVKGLTNSSSVLNGTRTMPSTLFRSNGYSRGVCEETQHASSLNIMKTFVQTVGNAASLVPGSFSQSKSVIGSRYLEQELPLFTLIVGQVKSRRFPMLGKKGELYVENQNHEVQGNLFLGEQAEELQEGLRENDGSTPLYQRQGVKSVRYLDANEVQGIVGFTFETTSQSSRN